MSCRGSRAISRLCRPGETDCKTIARGEMLRAMLAMIAGRIPAIFRIAMLLCLRIGLDPNWGFEYFFERFLLRQLTFRSAHSSALQRRSNVTQVIADRSPSLRSPQPFRPSTATSPAAEVRARTICAEEAFCITHLLSLLIRALVLHGTDQSVRCKPHNSELNIQKYHQVGLVKPPITMLRSLLAGRPPSPLK